MKVRWQKLQPMRGLPMVWEGLGGGFGGFEGVEQSQGVGKEGRCAFKGEWGIWGGNGMVGK